MHVAKDKKKNTFKWHVNYGGNEFQFENGHFVDRMFFYAHAHFNRATDFISNYVR